MNTWHKRKRTDVASGLSFSVRQPSQTFAQTMAHKMATVLKENQRLREALTQIANGEGEAAAIARAALAGGQVSGDKD